MEARMVRIFSFYLMLQVWAFEKPNRPEVR